jgi:peptidoglycan/LPS O-acetylase OafA/YrhL
MTQVSRLRSTLEQLRLGVPASSVGCPAVRPFGGYPPGAQSTRIVEGLWVRSALGHSRGLDGVRGVAILAVFGLHFFQLRGGFYGVDLFFVLSGFLITTLLLEERVRTGGTSLGSFYVRRARRLLPALVAFLVVVILVGSLVFTAGRLAEMVGGSLFYCLNIIGAFGHRDVFTKSPVNHLWSLSQEEQFYLVWPALLSLSLRRVRESQLLVPLLRAFVALAIYRAGLVAGGAGYDRIYFGPDTHADGLVIGCAAAVARRRGLQLPAWVGAVALAVLLVAFAGGDFSFHWNVLELPIVNLVAAAVVLEATHGQRMTRMLSIRPLPWFGAISYSLYLWHEFARWLIAGPHPLPELVLTIPLALGSYYVIERPFRRRHRRIAPEPIAAPAVG